MACYMATRSVPKMRLEIARKGWALRYKSGEKMWRLCVLRKGDVCPLPPIYIIGMCARRSALCGASYKGAGECVSLP